MNNRYNAVVGQQTALRYEFKVDGVLSNVSSWTNVKIYAEDPEANPLAVPIQTIAPAGITQIGVGVYEYTMNAVGTAGPYWDQQILVPAVGFGPITTQDHVQVVAFSGGGAGGLTAQDIRDELEGYEVDASTITSDWIMRKMTHSVIPIVEQVIRTPLSGDPTIVTEYLNGNGSDILILSKKNVSRIVDIRPVVSTDYPISWPISGFILQDGGIVKAVFTALAPTGYTNFPRGERNIKVVYEIGWASENVPATITNAIKLLTCEKVLGLLAGRTGGGNLSVQAWNRDFGARGKYTIIRDDMKREAFYLLRPFMTGVTGA